MTTSTMAETSTAAGGGGARRGPIGLDAGSRELRAVQVAGGAGARRVRAALRLPRRAPGTPWSLDEARAAVDALDRRGFRGPRAVILPTAAASYCATLDLPPRASGAPLEAIAEGELARMNRVEGQALQVALWELPGAPGRPTQCMGVGCLAAEIEAAAALWCAAGLDVSAADAIPLAVTRGTAGAPGPGLTGQLHLGDEATALCITSGGMLVFERVLVESALPALAARLGTELRLTGADAMEALLALGLDSPRGALPPAGCRAVRAFAGVVADDVRTSFQYAAGRFASQAPGRLLISGPGAAIPGLGRAIGAALRLEVEIASPAGRIECSAALRDVVFHPAMAAALGLALHEEPA